LVRFFIDNVTGEYMAYDPEKLHLNSNPKTEITEEQYNKYLQNRYDGIDWLEVAWRN
jgi:hypothetical protein